MLCGLLSSILIDHIVRQTAQELLYCRGLMQDGNLRQNQISAANRFLSLLVPGEKLGGTLINRGPPSLEYTPSMVAASAVLNSKRP